MADVVVLVEGGVLMRDRARAAGRGRGRMRCGATRLEGIPKEDVTTGLYGRCRCECDDDGVGGGRGYRGGGVGGRDGDGVVGDGGGPCASALASSLSIVVGPLGHRVQEAEAGAWRRQAPTLHS